MEDPIISYKYFRDIMKDYFEAPLNTIIEVLEDINDDELEFKIEKYRK